MVITLVGYRGSGKSSVAGSLAAALGWESCDADAELERRAGRTIRAIFAEDGEPYFRLLERAVMAELLRRDRLVIAAGGGAVLHAETRREMRGAGPVVWLKASAETIERRIAGDRTTADRRPDLTAAGGRAEIEELLVRREPLYREAATVTVETDGRSVDKIVAAVLESVGPLAGRGGGR